MTLFIISFVAGMLTVLAPCILPLLPVVIGSSATGRGLRAPLVVIGSLGVSIIVFTFLLKASTIFIDIPQTFWSSLSGGILLFFGLTLLFPKLWAQLPFVSKTQQRAQSTLGKGATKKSVVGDMMVGTALGPVFSTCSPTYFVILATVLPSSIFLGTLYLLTYVAGLSLMLFLIAIIGQRFANALAVGVESHGRIKKVFGLVFCIVGLFIMTGYEKKIETRLLESGWFDVTKIEHKLLKTEEPTLNIAPSEVEAAPRSPQSPDAQTMQCLDDGSGVCDKTMNRLEVRDAIDDMRVYTKYSEITAPSGYLNTNDVPITIAGELEKGNVVLIDFITYSCSNCRAVIPHLNRWNAIYKDKGLSIIGIHAPEFVFERDIENVRKALASLKIAFPVVLDNDFTTWRAYNNRFWPHLFIIDRSGNVVYDHVGEGNYVETERIIQKMLLP
jgi:cytochrome c biogenesis protein CcdA/thiol-disulfide isomerase/thioredoxin